MKLGFLTACLPDRSLDDIAAWASKTGFEALEVASWPAQGNRPFTASHLLIEDFEQSGADTGGRSVRSARSDPFLAGLLRQQPAP